jgi:hypothetical protein
MVSQRQADQACAVALVRRQFVGQDGDENQVVDAEHDFEHDECEQSRPDGGVEQPFHINTSFT